MIHVNFFYIFYLLVFTASDFNIVNIVGGFTGLFVGKDIISIYEVIEFLVNIPHKMIKKWDD
jgi:hypothetical protein